MTGRLFPALIEALEAIMASAPEASPSVMAPAELAALIEQAQPGASVHLDAIARRMRAWGREMPAMHVARQADGSVAASSEDPGIPPPAGETQFAMIEAKVGRSLPEALRQLYGLADGGFGPAAGLYSLERVALEYDDLCRRGADYSGDTAWPRHLLPLSEELGPIAYDLERGVIVGFDRAFTDLFPSLEAWLKDWIAASR